jgi:predicted metalloendopeptidase
MDKSVNPCEDFYSFACGGFEAKNVIPDDQSSVTTFSLISDEVTEQLRSLIERPIKDGDAEPFKLVKKVNISFVYHLFSPKMIIFFISFPALPVVSEQDSS